MCVSGYELGKKYVKVTRQLSAWFGGDYLFFICGIFVEYSVNFWADMSMLVRCE